MLRLCLSAISGAAICSALPALPARHWLLFFLFLALLLARHRDSRLWAALLGGFGCFGWVAQEVLDQRLALQLHRTDIVFIAKVIDFTRVNPGSIRFAVSARDARLPPLIQLSWYRAQLVPQLGETWQFEARLKRPRGTFNPGGFDYEAWLHRERIGASGYVLRGERIRNASSTDLPGLRLQAARRIEQLLPAGPSRAALLAIAIGARHEMNAAAWRRYAATGTSHLMAISGLHVGIAAGAATMLVWALGGLMRPVGNLRDRSMLAAIPVAATYAALSGFAVPAQRALLMTVCAVIVLCLRRTPQAPAALALVALVVLLLDPLALLLPGFLLSFGAVAILLHVSGHRPSSTSSTSLAGAWLQDLGRLQGALLLGLLPLTALLFARSAWLAPLANLLVLPLFTVVTVPAALVGLLLGGPLAVLGDPLLWLAWYSLRVIHRLIDFLALIPGSEFAVPELHGMSMFLLVLPCLWLLPAGFPGRSLAWLSFAALAIYRPAAIPTACVELHALDVGQGLAVYLRTRQHALLYDTGPAYASGSSSAERVILPFLRSRRVSSLDTLVVSHADQDHAGGAALLVREISIDRLLVGEWLELDHPQVGCRRGQRWQWDGVRFTVLHPHAGNATEGNNSSCVIRVEVGQLSMLLTGDIEAATERSLLHAGEIDVTSLVLVPHHGSRTSSTAEFISKLNAEIAIASAGFENRWGFPKQDVVARWTAAGTRLMNTAESGAISFRACADGELTLLGEYRRQAQRYWHDRDL